MILQLKGGGKLRRELEDLFRKEGYWIHSIHPKSFKRSFDSLDLNCSLDDLDVEYEYVSNEYKHMLTNLKLDRKGVCLIVVDISLESLEKLKEDYPTFSYKDFNGNKTVQETFEALVKPLVKLEVSI